MKVVISGYVGKKITGIGRNIISLLNNSLEPIQFVIYVPYDMITDFHFENKNIIVKSYKVSKFSSIKNLIWTTFVFPHMVKKEKADLALIPNFTLLLRKPVPTFVIMHDLIEFNVKNKFSKLKMFYRTKIADPITAKKADGIITVSQNSKKDIVHFLKVKEDKIFVIYDGVDRSIFKKTKLDEKSKTIFKKWGLDKYYILYVGTIDYPGKNSLNIIKAFEQLKLKKAYNGKCVLAGMPGTNYDFVIDYAKKSKCCDDILFLGYVDDSLLPYLYSNCDVFCFVSLYEGFGIPPLEALSCGAKVVASNNSSLPEVMGNCGLLVNPLSIEEIESGIKESLVSKEIDMNEINKHLSKFDWKLLGKQFSNLLIDWKQKK